MSQNISKQTLDALANTALTALQIGIDSNTPRVEYSLNDFGARGALLDLILHRFKVKPGDLFVGGLGEGFELGLRVAATIYTDPLNLQIQCAAIEAQLADSVQNWGETFQSQRAA